MTYHRPVALATQIAAIRRRLAWHIDQRAFAIQLAGHRALSIARRRHWAGRARHHAEAIRDLRAMLRGRTEQAA